jgi:Cu(I)/Ag(I) efflux system membrane fusion protein
MNRNLFSLVAAALATLALAGCSDANDYEGSAGGGAMPGMQQQAAPNAAVHAAEGTVNSVDLAAHTVSLSHGPVASANWPAMTMTFALADAEATAADLRPGQKVKFQFTIQSGMAATVTDISPAE